MMDPLHNEWDYALKYRSVTVSSLRRVLAVAPLNGCRIFANPVTGALAVVRRGKQIGYIDLSGREAHFERFAEGGDPESVKKVAP